MHSSRMRSARFSGHCEQNDWQTGVKALPCSKLRLRAVKIWTGERPKFYCVDPPLLTTVNLLVTFILGQNIIEI